MAVSRLLGCVIQNRCPGASSQGQTSPPERGCKRMPVTLATPGKGVGMRNEPPPTAAPEPGVPRRAWVRVIGARGWPACARSWVCLAVMVNLLTGRGSDRGVEQGHGRLRAQGHVRAYVDHGVVATAAHRERGDADRAGGICDGGAAYLAGRLAAEPGLSAACQSPLMALLSLCKLSALKLGTALAVSAPPSTASTALATTGP